MFRDDDRKMLVRAAHCFRSLDGHKTLYAMAALAGLKRLQDAFDEHIVAVRKASEGAAVPGIALFWVPPQCRGDFTTDAQVRAACQALEAENPSLKDSLTTLWPGAPDHEVAAAWAHLRDLDWRTERLLSGGSKDVVGETYEMLKGEIKVRAGLHNGEFFTPEHVVWMMVKMTSPGIGKSVCDPCCGSGRMLVLTALHLLEEHGWMTQETGSDHPLGAGHRLVVPPPALLVGQDIACHGPAMGRISLTALGYLNSVFVVRDSLTAPVTLEEVHANVLDRGADLLKLQPMHLVTADVQVKKRVTVSTPTLVAGPPAAARKARRAKKSGRTVRSASLETFGA